jgi:lipopolysaccharide/colanic/teichoic acid biosynthesis glycosyltransferase
VLSETYQEVAMIRQNTLQMEMPSLVARNIEAGRPVVELAGNTSAYYQLAKRVIDIAGSLAVLVLLSPAMLAVLVILTVTTRGRPFFFQKRAGHLGKTFWMAKFRTMRLDADKVKHLVQNETTGPVFKNRVDPRITAIGRILRKTSLDETPQLFHVLFGQMSLVGPRPLDVHEVSRFVPWQLQRLAVKPGLTCLWQVSGRSDIGFDDWTRMDIWYVRNQNLLVDLWLLIKTPLKVLSCKGAY